MRATAWLACTVLAVGGCPAAAIGGEPTLEEREDIVTQGVGGAEAWVALIRAYRYTNVGKPVAEWALRTALVRHPGHPLLLIQKATLRAPHAAYPVLDELGRTPGWEVRARELAEVLSFRLSIPDDGILDASYYTGEHWWSRLLDEMRFSRALEIVEEGLRRKPGDRELLARRALTLALLGRNEEALKDQEASGWMQVKGGRFGGIGDAWTVLRRPDLAYRSFGGAVPGMGRARMVHALLLARRGDLDAAEKLLNPASQEHMLLLLGLLLENGRFDRAVALQDAVVALVGRKLGSNFDQSIGPQWGSSESPMARAIRWLRGRPIVEPVLWDRDPRHLNWSVEADLPPEAREWIALERRITNRTPPTDELIGIFARMYEVVRLRGQHGWPHPLQTKGILLVEAGRMEEGLAALAAGALGPRDPRDAPGDTRLDTAAEWALAQTGRDAEILAAAEPLGFIPVRRALSAMNAVKDENRVLPEALNPPLDREIRELVSRGRGVLPAVIAAYPRRTIGGGGSRPYLLAVIAQLGGPREVPFLLSEIRFHEMWVGEAREPPWVAMAASGAAAIDRCLARVTGIAPDSADRKDRRAAWTTWWWARAPEILGAK